MNKLGFSSEAYLKIQHKAIYDRVYNNYKYTTLYLEFGGKLFNDDHAARVLPGFDPDAKIKLLESMKYDIEVILCLYAGDINKIRSGNGKTYLNDIVDTINKLRNFQIPVKHVVITRAEKGEIVDLLQAKCMFDNMQIKTHIHRFTEGYPDSVDTIVSPKGYGRNDYIEVEAPIVVVTGPGAGSGKLATCLSQLYHEKLKGNKATYSKFETFPVWNLPLEHPVNMAYESATVDINDRNGIDPYHKEAYGIDAINYNRDIEAFPLLQKILTSIHGECEFKSPTDMGVNMVADCIYDMEVVEESAKQECQRRYINKCKSVIDGAISTEENLELERHERILSILNLI